MIYRIYPNKDNTIYENDKLKLQNTGKDQILEIGKFYNLDNTTLLGNSRILLGFDLTPISFRAPHNKAELTCSPEVNTTSSSLLIKFFEIAFD